MLKLEVTPTVVRGRVIRPGGHQDQVWCVVENNSRGAVVDLGLERRSAPAINKRKAETQVLIKEGERLVIGGVTQQ